MPISMLEEFKLKISRYENALKEIAYMRSSSFRSYEDDRRAMEFIARRALAEPKSY
jgi:hypothetical protein